jgi:hypothetical protein
MSWFEAEVMKNRKAPSDRSAENPLISRDPMFVLSLVVKYDLTALTREAIHERVGHGPFEEN